MFAYPSEGVGEPMPMEPDPEAKEDDDDTGVITASPLPLNLAMHMPMHICHHSYLAATCVFPLDRCFGSAWYVCCPNQTDLSSPCASVISQNPL